MKTPNHTTAVTATAALIAAVLAVGGGGTPWSAARQPAAAAASTQPSDVQPEVLTAPTTQPATAAAGADAPVYTSGHVAITVVRPSTGGAKNGDTVFVHYAGRLQANGQEFDNSYKRGDPIEFELGAGKVIKGWDEGLLGMKVGEKRQLVIPPPAAYGSKDNGPIPANSTLIFDVELVGVRRPAQ